MKVKCCTCSAVTVEEADDDGEGGDDRDNLQNWKPGILQTMTTEKHLAQSQVPPPPPGNTCCT